MKLLIIDNTEAADRSFNQPLIDMASRFASCEVANYREADETYVTEGNFKGVILSGVPLHYSPDVLYDRAARLEWLKSTSLPVLGICLGHQSMGRVFGASMLEDMEGESGLYPIRISAAGVNDPIFAGITGNSFKVAALHRCSITVPEDFTLLASSKICKNQVMKHKAKPLYGLEFHPEHSDKTAILLKNFAQLSVGSLQALPLE